MSILALYKDVQTANTLRDLLTSITTVMITLAVLIAVGELRTARGG